MKKLIMSMVAAPLLVTSAFALEDIKVDGQAKLWYESSNALGKNGSDTLFNTEQSSAEVVFKLGMTGKQGDVSFGTTVYQSSTMGLEGTLVGGTRTAVANGDMFVGEAYIVAPLGMSTIAKIGKQELDTPLAFTERWNAIPNTFNAAVALNNSIDDLTLAMAYVGQTNTGIAADPDADADAAAVLPDPETGVTNNGSWKVQGDVSDQFYSGAGAIAALYNNKTVAVNFWAYYIKNVLSNGVAGDLPAGIDNGLNVTAAWLDGSMKIGDVANVKLYGAYVGHDDSINEPGKTVAGITGDATMAGALSADATFGGWTIFAAASTVTEGDLPVANTATGFKKTKLPTAGVYTDGLYVGQPGSTAVKLKASGKVASTGITLQGVYNMNSGEDGEAMGINAGAVNTAVNTNYSGVGFAAQTLETTEVDLIVSQKLGVWNNKLIIMHRGFADTATDDAKGGQYVRLVTSVNF